MLKEKVKKLSFVDVKLDCHVQKDEERENKKYHKYVVLTMKAP